MTAFNLFHGRTSPAHPRDADLSLAFLGAIVESSDDAIVGVTLQAQVISWNAAATRMYGHTAPEMIGHPVWRVVPEELRDNELAVFDKVRHGERVDHFETTRLTKDGRRLCVSLSVSPVRNAAGDVIAASTVARDIDVQKQAERATAQLAAIVESTDDAVVSKDLDGIVQTWNAGAERIFGYPAAAMVGCSILTLIPPELQDEEATILKRIRAGDRIEHFDTIRIRSDGRRIPVSLTISPIRDADGRVVGASKIARDISERRHAEADIRANRRKLAWEITALARLSEASTRLWESRDLADGLAEILKTAKALTGAERGIVQFMNPGRETLSIVACDGLGPDFLASFEHISVHDRRAACGRALANGRAAVIEDVLTDPGYESYREVAQTAEYRAVVAAPLFAADGGILGAISVYFASPHRPAETEVRRLQLYCRQASDFIERIRMEHALRQREEALREADRRKDEFLAMLAHELRNPLAPIRYALALGRQPGIAPERVQRAQEVIERQVAHMSRLLDDLLDISRITRGALELKKGDVSLKSILDTSIEAAQPYLEAKRHRFLLILPDHPVWLEADGVRMAQVFTNLLINAAKYTGEGGTIELVAENDDGVKVTVRDNGMGIAADALPRLFSFFARAAQPAGQVDQGLGVGLAMVRGLVELHGGTVEARSAGPGCGSEFVVRLPVDRVAPAAEASPAVSTAPPRVSRRVLVVDDNRDAADSCATLLELMGHRVATAYNGTRALQIAGRFRPDVALLDIGLPDINGYEVARRIRATDWGAHLPLVAVTGWGKDEDRQRAIEAGFDRHLTKPVAPGTIAALVGTLALPEAADAD